MQWFQHDIIEKLKKTQWKKHCNLSPSTFPFTLAHFSHHLGTFWPVTEVSSHECSQLCCLRWLLHSLDPFKMLIFCDCSLIWFWLQRSADGTWIQVLGIRWTRAQPAPLLDGVLWEHDGTSVCPMKWWVNDAYGIYHNKLTFQYSAYISFWILHMVRDS